MLCLKMDSRVTYLQMLPEELILHICRYLEIEDKILIVKEYKMFNYILARKLEFGGRYHLSKVFLKSAFKMEIRWDLVEELNLTSCYCLTREDIFAIVKKTKHLKALYLADTKTFSLEQLGRMLSPLSQLTRLSLTYDSLYQEAEVETLRECLERLEFCFLFFPTKGSTHSQRVLNKFLSLMTELRELWAHCFTEQLESAGDRTQDLWIWCQAFRAARPRG
uniref:F-box domain-containing protein n=1 Tax=Timema monikensis TaxID=170555 RepID=A0A7R9HSR6_9NEOP|nr:unnamed protein product [Timema monikensis]